MGDQSALPTDSRHSFQHYNTILSQRLSDVSLILITDYRKMHSLALLFFFCEHFLTNRRMTNFMQCKGKGSPYSTAERRVPELIPEG